MVMRLMDSACALTVPQLLAAPGRGLRHNSPNYSICWREGGKSIGFISILPAGIMLITG